jgi:hypothetical protein
MVFGNHHDSTVRQGETVLSGNTAGQNTVGHNGVGNNTLGHSGVGHNTVGQNTTGHSHHTGHESALGQNTVGHNNTVNNSTLGHNGVGHNNTVGTGNTLGHNTLGHNGVGHNDATGYDSTSKHHNKMAHGTNDRSNDTGLLTRCVPQKLKHSALYRWWLRFTRILQFLSAIISLGIFSARFYKVYRLVNSFKAERGINGSSKAVEAILALAVLYTILATIMMCLLRGGGPKFLRWLFVLLDILFVAAFIVVAVLTRPNGGSAGPHHCYGSRSQAVDGTGRNANNTDQSCNLPWGTFILAIISA